MAVSGGAVGSMPVSSHPVSAGMLAAEGATDFPVAIDVFMAATAIVTKSVAKAVAAGLDVAASFRKAVGKNVLAGCDGATSVVKACTNTLAIGIETSVTTWIGRYQEISANVVLTTQSVLLNIGKLVLPGVSMAVASPLKEVVKFVNGLVDLALTVRKDISHLISALIELTSTAGIGFSQTLTIGLRASVEITREVGKILEMVVSLLADWVRIAFPPSMWTEGGGAADGWTERPPVSDGWTKQDALQDGWTEEAPGGTGWTEEGSGGSGGGNWT